MVACVGPAGGGGTVVPAKMQKYSSAEAKQRMSNAVVRELDGTVARRQLAVVALRRHTQTLLSSVFFVQRLTRLVSDDDDD